MSNKEVVYLIDLFLFKCCSWGSAFSHKIVGRWCFSAFESTRHRISWFPMYFPACCLSIIVSLALATQRFPIFHLRSYVIVLSTGYKGRIFCETRWIRQCHCFPAFFSSDLGKLHRLAIILKSEYSPPYFIKFSIQTFQKIIQRSRVTIFL